MSKLLTVFGATGLQGGSVINYVLRSPELSKTYRIRGITRDVSKPAAIALKEKGIEVVKVKRLAFYCSVPTESIFFFQHPFSIISIMK